MGVDASARDLSFTQPHRGGTDARKHASSAPARREVHPSGPSRPALVLLWSSVLRSFDAPLMLLVNTTGLKLHENSVCVFLFSVVASLSRSLEDQTGQRTFKLLEVVLSSLTVSRV